MDDNRDNNTCCRKKATPRSLETQLRWQARLNKAIGQCRGIKKMIDDNRYCGDILIQIAAVEKALENLGYEILRDHMNTCVVEEVKKGNTDIVSEAVELMKKLK